MASYDVASTTNQSYLVSAAAAGIRGTEIRTDQCGVRFGDQAHAHALAAHAGHWAHRRRVQNRLVVAAQVEIESKV